MRSGIAFEDQGFSALGCPQQQGDSKAEQLYDHTADGGLRGQNLTKPIALAVVVLNGGLKLGASVSESTNDTAVVVYGGHEALVRVCLMLGGWMADIGLHGSGRFLVGGLVEEDEMNEGAASGLGG